MFLSELLRFLKERVGDRDCSFHRGSITRVIPAVKRLESARACMAAQRSLVPRKARAPFHAGAGRTAAPWPPR